MQQNQLMIQPHVAIEDSNNCRFQKGLEAENHRWCLTLWPFLTLHARPSFDALCSRAYKVLRNTKSC